MKSLKNYLSRLLSLVFLTVIAIACSDKDLPNQVSGEGIFTTQSGEASIEGELFIPDGQGPFPVLIIVPGSGNDTRESLTPFVEIINSFGYALYIYDKRGLGGSTGNYPTETVDNPFDFLSARAQDIIGIIDLLKKHIDIDQSQIGLFGSSQGTWVNCIVYNQIKNDISLILMLSGGATSTQVEQYYEDLLESLNISIKEANKMLYEYDGELGFDPVPILENMDIPVLFIYGGMDDSHPTLYDKEVIENMQKVNFTIHFYSNANHDLLDVDTNTFPTNLFSGLETWLNLNN